MAQERNWQFYTVAEGLTKTASAIFQKVAGVAMNSGSLAMIYSLGIGVLQIIAGIIGMRVKAGNENRAEVSFEFRQILWPVAFGFFASLANISGPLAFMHDADLTARTLIVLCSIIPGTFIGMAFFGERYDFWQWLGIGVFLFAVWAILNFPRWDISSGEVPIWVWITLVPLFTNAINEGLTKKAAVKLDIWSNSFWIGVSTVIWSQIFLFVWWIWAGEVSLNIGKAFVWATLITGVIVIFMISFKFLAYKSDAWIALKKILMNGTYLVTAAVVGFLFFDEALTFGKFVGIGAFLLALLLSDKKARSVFGNKKETAV